MIELAWPLILFLVIALFLFWYYCHFPNYSVLYQSPYNSKRKNIGNPLPAFPNGWFIIGRSDSLKINQVLNLEKWGENIVVFRGSNKKVYALEAYCLHMGSNLAVEGKVKNESCIQCPFHGWCYDGETGNCVDSNKVPLSGISFQYPKDITNLNNMKLEWQSRDEKQIKLRKYPIKELNAYIYIWIHAKSEFQAIPQFDVFDLGFLTNQLTFRGKAKNIIKCHIQDIPENGADVMHFYYVHRYLNRFIKFIYLIWKAAWKKGSDPEIKQHFIHKVSYINDFKKKLYTNFVQNSKQPQSFGVSTVDGYPNLPIIGQFFAFNITVFQVGSGIVYIFVKFYFFTLVFVQYVHIQEKYTQELYHDIYTPKWFPYWLSAFFLKIQSLQVLNDSYIWDAKQFKKKVIYMKQNKADQSMRKWRQWYYQFYDGSQQRQQNNIRW